MTLKLLETLNIKAGIQVHLLSGKWRHKGEWNWLSFLFYRNVSSTYVCKNMKKQVTAIWAELFSYFLPIIVSIFQHYALHTSYNIFTVELNNVKYWYWKYRCTGGLLFVTFEKHIDAYQITVSLAEIGEKSNHITMDEYYD